MNTFFATELPNPNNFASIGWVCVILVAVVIGLRQGIGFVGDLKDKPAAGEVRAEAHESFVAKDTFESHVVENRSVHEQLFSKLGGVERGAKSAIQEQVEGVRKEVSQCGRDISGLKVETQLQNQSLARVEAKLDRLIERKA